MNDQEPKNLIAHSQSCDLNEKTLSQKQVDSFHQKGYLILPSFIPPNLVEMLKKETDYWVDEGWRDKSIEYCREMRRDKPSLIELELGEHGWLITYPPLMKILTQLMGDGFAFHHLHSNRNISGSPDKNWHHDYEQYPQSNRFHMMIHVFHYLDGLNGTIGDLVVLPGSHTIIAEKKAFEGFGTMSLSGEIVIDNLPSGSTVIIQSSLFHARRAKPGGEGKPRYLIDCSYCETGIRWPVVKPYWQKMLTCAKNLGLARDQWDDIFSERHFYDPYIYKTAFEKINQGSLMERLIPDFPDKKELNKVIKSGES
ncbi:MAG: phytanoyl-CoA dioxygenase family protein [Moorea sp. SIO2B7]|nr:phytanoyl-CoA dioxygenase family protein [Moorena sp. SIO2B7]